VILKVQEHASARLCDLANKVRTIPGEQLGPYFESSDVRSDLTGKPYGLVTLIHVKCNHETAAQVFSPRWSILLINSIAA
jgi:hypothetical protein